MIVLAYVHALQLVIPSTVGGQQDCFPPPRLADNVLSNLVLAEPGLVAKDHANHHVLRSYFGPESASRSSASPESSVVRGALETYQQCTR